MMSRTVGRLAIAMVFDMASTLTAFAYVDCTTLEFFVVVSNKCFVKDLYKKNLFIVCKPKSSESTSALILIVYSEFTLCYNKITRVISNTASHLFQITSNTCFNCLTISKGHLQLCDQLPQCLLFVTNESLKSKEHFT